MKTGPDGHAALLRVRELSRSSIDQLSIAISDTRSASRAALLSLAAAHSKALVALVDEWLSDDGHRRCANCGNNCPDDLVSTTAGHVCLDTHSCIERREAVRHV